MKFELGTKTEKTVRVNLSIEKFTQADKVEIERCFLTVGTKRFIIASLHPTAGCMFFWHSPDYSGATPTGSIEVSLRNYSRAIQDDTRLYRRETNNK